MAGGSLLTLLDDIATVLDDIAVMTKVATKKTAGVLGDDLALNAQQVTGVRAEREIPVVWAVAKGSMRNKIILVPAALLISAVMPWAITPLLMLGGAFLCFEGCEKLAHKFLHRAEEESHHAQLTQALVNPDIDLLALEKEKIKGSEVIILNALRKEQHISHFSLPEAIALLEELQPKRAYLTHISHLMGFHAEVEKELPPFIRLAYDGLQIQV